MLSLVLLYIFFRVAEGRLAPSESNVIATAIATVPSYYLNRTWAWGKTGKSHLMREVVPFWVIAAVSIVLSTVVVGWADHEALAPPLPQARDAHRRGGEPRHLRRDLGRQVHLVQQGALREASGEPEPAAVAELIRCSASHPPRRRARSRAQHGGEVASSPRRGSRPSRSATDARSDAAAPSPRAARGRSPAGSIDGGVARRRDLDDVRPLGDGLEA